LATILTQLAPWEGVVASHEHPLSRTLIPLSHLHQPLAERLALWLAWTKNRALQQIRIDPLLSHCAATPLARCSDRVVFISRRPSSWAESLARKICYQKLFPLIRTTPLLRPPAPAPIRELLQHRLPKESPYLMGLLAAYVALHRAVDALQLSEPILQLRYEDLYGAPGSVPWQQAWQRLWQALAWPVPIPWDQVQTLQQRRQNAAPVLLRRSLHDPKAVDAVVYGLIRHGWE